MNSAGPPKWSNVRSPDIASAWKRYETLSPVMVKLVPSAVIAVHIVSYCL